MYEHNALGYRSGLALCLTKVILFILLSYEYFFPLVFLFRNVHFNSSMIS